MNRRSKQAPQRYERSGILAVDPKAFLEFFMVPESRENEMIGNAAIVDVCGPLESHDSGWCDSYEAIRARVQTALDSSATAVVLRLDSPGGDTKGCFETARAVRTMCRAAGKPLYAYVEKACSAAYAFAAAADWICLSETGTIGSIGVIATRSDYSAMNAARGLRVAFIASGARKLDGHPDAPLTEAEIKATQQLVDSLAGVFFALVADLRGLSAEAVEALDARVLCGDAAVKARLADEVLNFDGLLALVASGKATNTMASAYEKARASLEEAAKGDDANAAAAKRALAAMADPKPDEPDAAEGDDEDDDDDEPASSDDSADGDAPPPKKDKEPPAAAATTASAHDIAVQALSESHRLRAELAEAKERGKRKRLIASRPDFSPEMVAVLRDPKTSLETVRNMVKTLPVVPTAAGGSDPTKIAAASTAAGTRGAGQGTGAATLTSEEAEARAEQQRRMGLTTTRMGARREGNSMVFGIIEEPIKPAADSGAVGGVK